MIISLRSNDNPLRGMIICLRQNKGRNLLKFLAGFFHYLINIKINHNGAMVRGEEGIIVEDYSELLRRKCAPVIEKRVVDRFAVRICGYYGSEIEAK
jgi:hypothetical protein